MRNILQLVSEQPKFLKQKGYSNKDLHFEGSPDITYTDLLNLFSEGTP